MRFEKIAEQLGKEEGKKISTPTVIRTYYKALNKLRKQVEEDEELRKKLLTLIEEDVEPTPLINEILKNVIELEHD